MPAASPVLDRIGRLKLQLLAHAQLRVRLGFAYDTTYPAHLAPALFIVAFRIIFVWARVIDIDILTGVVGFVSLSEGS